MSIRDFFKPKVTVPPGENKNEDSLKLSTGFHNAPNVISIDSDEGPRAETTIGAMKRSSSTMVKTKSNSSSPTKARKAKAFVIEDSESDEEIFSALPDTLEEFIPETVVKSKPKRIAVSDEEEKYTTESDAGEEIPVKKAKVTKAAKTEASTDDSTPKKKFNYHAFLAKKSSVPVALGSKEIPEGSPNCLEGLTFVFTGELSSIGRDDATDLVKRYGARVTTAPSGKTDYVILGENAGASKLEKIEKLNLKTLDEDGLFDLIRKLSPNAAQKKPSEEPVIILNTTEKTATSKILESNRSNITAAERPVVAPPSSDLWTVKWAPKRPEDLIGNNSIYEKLRSWLNEWKTGVPSEFRAVLLSGSPGIGKTTMAHMACKQVGFDIVELNASDTRSKKTLHEQVREVINNSSLSSFFKTSAGSPEHKLKKQCIIMDECDGMSAGDRGGMAELIQLIKKTKVPIICACNDRNSPKVRSLANHCMDLRFRKPEARQVTPRITEICRQEGLTVSANTIEELVASTQGDLRQILNLLSTYRLTGQSLNFDESKKLGQSSKKDIDEGPFDATHTLLSGQGFGRMNLNQKIDLYFVDNGLMPLMIQENYLKSRANTPRTLYDPVYGGSGTGVNFMTLAWAAADSISKSDAVDSLIRGYNQEWSLAPLHAIHSCVRPAYFCSGNMSGRVDFAAWLGQNSKQQKYLRILKELTQHLYLNTRANKLTLCMDYAPTMAAILIKHLQSAETIDRAIEFLDNYSLAKEDVEPLLEIVLDPSCNSQAYAKLPTAIKSAFTRKYNQGTHLLPYALGAAVPVRKIKTDIRADGDGEDDDDNDDTVASSESGNGDDNEEESSDLSKDKMIKSKSTAATKKPTAAKRGAKK